MSATTTVPPRGSYLMPSLEHATVSDAMHPGVLRCEPDAPLTEVARMMASHHVHCIVVMGIVHAAPVESLAWGIISDIDLLRGAIADGREPVAHALARQPLLTVEPSMPLTDAAASMLKHGISHLVVVQPGTERPIGILSTADVAGILAWGEG